MDHHLITTFMQCNSLSTMLTLSTFQVCRKNCSKPYSSMFSSIGHLIRNFHIKYNIILQNWAVHYICESTVRIIGCISADRNISPSAHVLQFGIPLSHIGLSALSTDKNVLLPAVGSETLTGKVYWVNQMGDLPFVGMNSDACTFTTCPIQPDRRQTYEYQLSISKRFPVVSRNIVYPCSGVCM